jgi:beta-N-acetylhexosaminidase
MKKLLSLLLASLCILSLPGCGQSALQQPTSPAASVSVEAGTSDSTASSGGTAEKDVVSSLLNSLTLEEKVGQLFFARCPSSGAAQDVKAYHLGGYLLFGRDFKNLTANEIIQTVSIYQDAAKKDVGIPLLIGTDEEGGDVVRLSSNPRICRWAFASPQQLFAAGGMAKITQDTHRKDVLLKAMGINVNFAPVCDVSTDPADFIYARSFGQNADATANFVSRTVEQMNDDGMGSVLKHFPGYGNNADTHTGIAVDNRPLKHFESTDFIPFQAGIQQTNGETAVLVSHNIVKSMDAKRPASLSPAVHQLLREQLGFDGVVMTDDLAMDAVKAYAEDGSVALLALKAGNDMVLTTDYKTQIPQILSAVKSGSLSEEELDAACRRVLLWKQSLGLLANS